MNKNLDKCKRTYLYKNIKIFEKFAYNNFLKCSHKYEF